MCRVNDCTVSSSSLSPELVRCRFCGPLFSSSPVSSPVFPLLLLLMLLLLLLGGWELLGESLLTFDACAAVVEASDGGRPPPRPVDGSVVVVVLEKGCFFRKWSSTSATRATSTTANAIVKEAAMKLVGKTLCCLLNTFCGLHDGWISGTRFEELQPMGYSINCTDECGT